MIVAAVGNGDQAPKSPWPYASYPAALPHVIGVSAVGRDGSIPAFSDRDLVFNDIAAPGEDIFSTLPRSLTRENATCLDQGYSDCGPTDFRNAEGTSFAAPQVTAAAALLRAQAPGLTADQVASLIERTADDLNAANGCVSCPLLRDSLSGWGRLNIARALAVASRGTPPAADRFETNDDAGVDAARIGGTRGRIAATVDYWDDQTDVYSLDLAAGQKVTASVVGAPGTAVQLLLWSPRTRTVFGSPSRGLAVARSVRTGARQRVVYTSPPAKGGRYYVEVRIVQPGAGRYSLTWTKARR